LGPERHDRLFRIEPRGDVLRVPSKTLRAPTGCGNGVLRDGPGDERASDSRSNEIGRLVDPSELRPPRARRRTTEARVALVHLRPRSPHANRPALRKLA